MATSHSLKRKQALALARPVDNAGALSASIDPGFELSNTIFSSLPQGSMLEKVQKTKLDTVLDWRPSEAEKVETAYLQLAPLADVDDGACVEFMHRECDFSMEHADGSFLDHLYFCRDYTARHYPSGRPRVMLLHSICGVGTNMFPMAKEKLPQLTALLPPEEMAQVAAFPSVLRLLVHGPLLAELATLSRDEPSKLRTLRSFRCFRMLDNAPIELSADQLWENLNYQLIHAVDFLPAAAWKRTSNDILFQVFRELHGLLSRAGELRSSVAWDDAWQQADTLGARPPTWRHWAIDMLPDRLVAKLASKQVAKYSDAIGHTLTYQLDFGAGATER